MLENAAEVNNTENAPSESKSRRRIGLKWDKNRNNKRVCGKKEEDDNDAMQEAREIVATEMSRCRRRRKVEIEEREREGERGRERERERACGR